MALPPTYVAPRNSAITASSAAMSPPVRWRLATCQGKLACEQELADFLTAYPPKGRLHGIGFEALVSNRTASRVTKAAHCVYIRNPKSQHNYKLSWQVRSNAAVADSVGSINPTPFRREYAAQGMIKVLRSFTTPPSHRSTHMCTLPTPPA